MTADLEQVLEAEAELAAVGGNRPFTLNDLESVWFILAGKVDVFAEGGPEGARRHLFRLTAGQALFGVGAVPRAGLLAAPGSATRLARVPRRRLNQLATDPAHRAAVALLLEGWITAVSRGLDKGLPPKAF